MIYAVVHTLLYGSQVRGNGFLTGGVKSSVLTEPVLRIRNVPDVTAVDSSRPRSNVCERGGRSKNVASTAFDARPSTACTRYIFEAAPAFAQVRSRSTAVDGRKVSKFTLDHLL